MKKIFLVRHCAAYGQHRDSPLTYKGIRQSHALTEFFNRQNIQFDKIFSSPYLRAIESIKPYAEQTGLEIEIHENLRERVLSEQPLEDWLDTLEQSFIDPNFSISGGESGNDALKRANVVLNDVYSDDNLQNVIMVSHGNLFTLILNQFDNTYGFSHWKNLRNPDVYTLNMDNSVPSVECVWEV